MGNQNGIHGIHDPDLVRLRAEFKEVTRSIKANRPDRLRWQAVKRRTDDALRRRGNHRRHPVDTRAMQRSLACGSQRTKARRMTRRLREDR